MGLKGHRCKTRGIVAQGIWGRKIRCKKDGVSRCAAAVSVVVDGGIGESRPIDQKARMGIELRHCSKRASEYSMSCQGSKGGSLTLPSWLFSCFFNFFSKKHEKLKKKKKHKKSKHDAFLMPGPKPRASWLDQGAKGR